MEYIDKASGKNFTVYSLQSAKNICMFDVCMYDWLIDWLIRFDSIQDDKHDDDEDDVGDVKRLAHICVVNVAYENKRQETQVNQKFINQVKIRLIAMHAVHCISRVCICSIKGPKVKWR